jgi:hypothetical protein
VASPPTFCANRYFSVFSDALRPLGVEALRFELRERFDVLRVLGVLLCEFEVLLRELELLLRELDDELLLREFEVFWAIY